jgi:hypothetical protein
VGEQLELRLRRQHVGPIVLGNIVLGNTVL